jgi:fused signal recognition particle receptor
MFKFWKKKPAENAPPDSAEQGVGERSQRSASTLSDAALEDRIAVLAEAMEAARSLAAEPLPDAIAAPTAIAPTADSADSAPQANSVVEAAPAPMQTAPFARSIEPSAAELPTAAAAQPEAALETDTRAESIAAETAGASTAARAPWRERISGSSLARSFAGLFARNPKLDDDLLDEIETCLLTADVGVTATEDLIGQLRRRMGKREFSDALALIRALRAELRALLEPVAQPLRIEGAKPFVILTVGINGVGKTTSIGKLAHRYRGEGRQVLLAAGDTFRAAAVEQLRAWGDRIQVPVIHQGKDADSASVIFDALAAAKSRGFELLIADTAGRLHTQGGLMDELAKIRRVLGKLDPTAPHEVLMVIDGTTGQNAVSQVRQFRASAGVTGLIVTKLDGTAKGGVVFALAREFGLPIRFVGLGEKAEDLREFDPAAFVDALLPESLGA